MRQISEESPALVLGRQCVRGLASSVMVSTAIVDNGAISGASGSRAYVFPYGLGGSNLHQDAIRDLGLGDLPAWDVFAYLYAVLHAPVYRAQYGDAWMDDFPRIPPPPGVAVFHELASLGKTLLDYHLFRSPKIDTSRYEIQGDEFRVTDCKRQEPLRAGPRDRWPYEDSTQTLWFGPLVEYSPASGMSCIRGIPPEVWDYEVGGIQQLRQYLYSRRFSAAPKRNTLDRGLTPGDLEHLLTVAEAIRLTLALAPALDRVCALILGVPGGPP
jgi:hypothetical protein